MCIIVANNYRKSNRNAVYYAMIVFSIDKNVLMIRRKTRWEM